MVHTRPTRVNEPHIRGVYFSLVRNQKNRIPSVKPAMIPRQVRKGQGKRKNVCHLESRRKVRVHVSTGKGPPPLRVKQAEQRCYTFLPGSIAQYLSSGRYGKGTLSRCSAQVCIRPWYIVLYCIVHQKGFVIRSSNVLTARPLASARRSTSRCFPSS